MFIAGFAGTRFFSAGAKTVSSFGAAFHATAPPSPSPMVYDVSSSSPSSSSSSTGASSSVSSARSRLSSYAARSASLGFHRSSSGPYTSHGTDPSGLTLGFSPASFADSSDAFAFFASIVGGGSYSNVGSGSGSTRFGLGS